MRARVPVKISEKIFRNLEHQNRKALRDHLVRGTQR